MNRHQRRALRSQTPGARERPQTTSDPLDRLHLLEQNKREVERIAGQLPPADAVIICDTRDPMAHAIARGLWKKSDEEMRAWEAPFLMSGLIPTAILGVPRVVAIDLTAFSTPNTSELLERLPVEVGRPVLVISKGGTTMVTLPNEGRTSPKGAPPDSTPV